MKCPRDGTHLARAIIADMELDKCHRCDGIWCDHGEIERLRGKKLTEVEELLDQKYGDPSFQIGLTDGHMRCPRCGGGTRLVEYTVSYDKPVRIDRCQQCFGVWLDDRELNFLLEEKKVDTVKSEGPLRALLRSIGLLFQGEK